ncbi:MAG: YhcH/YjgK/YiaL family protein [Melioribacteraceae bacterium]|nr:YhcH/YjgK/YiaL family protein [Melioribacteraceae bacterium]
MIFDSIENAHLYYGVNAGIKKALEFLVQLDFTECEPGRIDIDGDNIFALVSRYSTKHESEVKWEAHRKYIDVQFVASGTENVGFINVDYLDVAQEYDAKKDVEFYDGEGDYLQLNEDEFMIFFPHDAHMPGIEVEESEEVLKVVIKVLAE